jgi:hypothetical protein
VGVVFFDFGDFMKIEYRNYSIYVMKEGIKGEYKSFAIIDGQNKYVPRQSGRGAKKRALDFAKNIVDDHFKKGAEI